MPEEAKPRMVRVGNAWVQPSMILSIEKAKGFTRNDGTFVGWVITLDKLKMGLAKDASPRRWVTGKQVKPILDFFGIEESTDPLPSSEATMGDLYSRFTEPCGTHGEQVEPPPPDDVDQGDDGKVPW